MIDLNEIDKYSELKALNIATEIINNRADFISEINKEIAEAINKELIEYNTEQVLFLNFMLSEILKFDTKSQHKIIEIYFPKGKGIILDAFQIFKSKGDTKI